MIESTFGAFDSENMNQAYKIQPLAKVINDMKEMLESHHVERLQVGDCGVAGGVALYDLVNSYQRIANHSKSISRHVIKRLTRDDSLDALHGRLVDKDTEEYLALEKYYYSKYIKPISEKKTKSVENESEAITDVVTKDISKDSKKVKKHENEKKHEHDKKPKKEEHYKDHKDKKKDRKKENSKDKKKD